MRPASPAFQVHDLYKAYVIALKDMRHALRSPMSWMFMLGLPLMVTGMFYLMFGSQAESGEFDLPRTQVVIANLDRQAPRLEAGQGSLPEGIHAHTLSELVVEVLRSDELADLVEVRLAADEAAARRAVDSQAADVAVIIPEGFARQFADLDGQATVWFYQDPTLTIGPQIVRSILSRFLDSLAGVKIALDEAQDVALTQAGPAAQALVGQVLQAYLANSRSQSSDLAEAFLVERPPAAKPGAQASKSNPVLAIVTPIMAGMMIFYAFFTGFSVAQSLVKEDEERTLARLFTTPMARSAILAGKFLPVFLTVLVQVVALLTISWALFGIDWGNPGTLLVAAVGVVPAAASLGIFANSMLKNTRQGGTVFGGVLVVTGMLGMIRVLAIGSPGAERLGETVSLLVPQGWAVRGLLGAVHGQTPAQVLPNLLVLLAWSGVFFGLAVWRFRRKYG